MNRTIRAKVVKIGNSRGIRIPRILLEQAGLADEVEMKVEGDCLIIYAANHPRQDWEVCYAAMAGQGDDQLLDQTSTTQWNEKEWTW
jgi:antitoxin MazE